MAFTAFKRLLIPNTVHPIRILRGPFRGAIICMNPRDNLRKIFGFYEHELNKWLERVLLQVDTVLDVGANDGYFTFGCAAAFRRLGKPAEIISFEPQATVIKLLQASLRSQPVSTSHIIVQQTLVGRLDEPGTTTLNEAGRRLLRPPSSQPPRRALVKIDVEGAELDVIEGASEWLRPEHFFLIEVHEKIYLDLLRERFAATGLVLERYDQKPLPLIGRENRLKENWWLASPAQGPGASRST